MRYPFFWRRTEGPAVHSFDAAKCYWLTRSGKPLYEVFRGQFLIEPPMGQALKLDSRCHTVDVLTYNKPSLEARVSYDRAMTYATFADTENRGRLYLALGWRDLTSEKRHFHHCTHNIITNNYSVSLRSSFPLDIAKSQGLRCSYTFGETSHLANLPSSQHHHSANSFQMVILGSINKRDLVSVMHLTRWGCHVLLFIRITVVLDNSSTRH